MHLQLRITQSPWLLKKVCNIITDVLGARYRKLPNTVEEMEEVIHGIENKYGFPQAFGSVDGTHIPMHNQARISMTLSYELKYTFDCSRNL